ncbi:MAG: hypothetical protein AAFR44_02170, partial [Pseudomonadota bacterium]
GEAPRVEGESGSELRIDAERLHARIAALAEIGAIDGGGCCRIALTEADLAQIDAAVAAAAASLTAP